MSREIDPFITHSQPLAYYYHHWFNEPGDPYPFTNNPLVDLIGNCAFWCECLPHPPIYVFPEIPPALVQKFHELDPSSFAVIHGATLYDRLTNPNYRNLNDTKNHPFNDLEIAVFSHLPADQANIVVQQVCAGFIEQDRQSMLHKFPSQFATRIFCHTHPASLSAPPYTQVQYNQDLYVWNYQNNEPPKTNFYEVHPVSLDSRSPETDFWSLYLPSYNSRFGNGGILMYMDGDKVQYRLYSPFPTNPGPAQIHLSHPDFYQDFYGVLWSLPHCHRVSLAAAFLAFDLKEPVWLAPETISVLRQSASLCASEKSLSKAIRRDHACMAQAEQIGHASVYIQALRLLLPSRYFTANTASAT